MASIRNYISSHLLAPLKQYPTVIQDTMLEIITEKFERLYEYTLLFPNIVTPNQNRLDILQAIADQFVFTVRDEADLQEQVDILDNILYVYNKRGSVDTIENMWKYYGGDLPKNVEVVIPSYNIFRYNISAFSGNHSYLKGRDCYVELDVPAPDDIDPDDIDPDDIEANITLRVPDKSRSIRITSTIQKGSTKINISNSAGLSVGDKVVVIPDTYEGHIVGLSSSNKEVLYDSVNTPGVYEIRLYNNTYPIPELKEFLLRELVAAGNEIYFTNALYMQNISDDMNSKNPYTYEVYPESFVQIQLEAMVPPVGLMLSGYEQSMLSLYKLDNPPSILPSISSSQWSGSGSLFIEFANIVDLYALDEDSMLMPGIVGRSDTLFRTRKVEYLYDDYLDNYYKEYGKYPEDYSESHNLPHISESSEIEVTTIADLNIQGYTEVQNGRNPDTNEELVNYPNYFILGVTLLDTNYKIPEVNVS